MQQSFLWLFQWALWQSWLQYRTQRQRPQYSMLPPPPHVAQDLWPPWKREVISMRLSPVYALAVFPKEIPSGFGYCMNRNMPSGCPQGPLQFSLDYALLLRNKGSTVSPRPPRPLRSPVPEQGQHGILPPPSPIDLLHHGCAAICVLQP